MLASLALMQSFVKQMRRDVAEAMLALPQMRRTNSAPQHDQERFELERWLFDRESR